MNPHRHNVKLSLQSSASRCNGLGSSLCTLACALFARRAYIHTYVYHTISCCIMLFLRPHSSMIDLQGQLTKLVNGLYFSLQVFGDKPCMSMHPAFFPEGVLNKSVAGVIQRRCERSSARNTCRYYHRCAEPWIKRGGRKHASRMKRETEGTREREQEMESERHRASEERVSWHACSDL